MSAKRRILAHVLIDLENVPGITDDATMAAMKSALQVGLSAQVVDLKVFTLASNASAPATLTLTDGQANLPPLSPPASESSDRDQVIETYTHSGMTVEIYRDAGRRARPTYFAVVTNPVAKSPTGAVINAPSYAELRKVAHARAERKSLQFRKRQSAIGAPAGQQLASINDKEQ